MKPIEKLSAPHGICRVCRLMLHKEDTKCPRCLSPIESKITTIVKNYENLISIEIGSLGYEIMKVLEKECDDWRWNAMMAKDILETVQKYYKDLQEPNIKLVNHPYNQHDEFQG